LSAECVFCEIMAGRAPGDIVYQDDLTAAFIDLRQHNPGPRQLGDGLLRVYPGVPVDAEPSVRASYAERLRNALGDPSQADHF
jgi:hypothetical protein